MGIGTIFPSIHKRDGWGGQYQRMIRWYNKFIATSPGNFENPNIDDHHDILYSCFQNIFYLKDWLQYDGAISKDKLNEFINDHIELQLCRDICNGTKHFDLNNPSIEADFTIIREYEPYHEVLGTEKNKIIILSGGHKFDLKELAQSCINLWDKFILENRVWDNKK